MLSEFNFTKKYLSLSLSMRCSVSYLNRYSKKFITNTFKSKIHLKKLYKSNGPRDNHKVGDTKYMYP